MKNYQARSSSTNKSEKSFKSGDGCSDEVLIKSFNAVDQTSRRISMIDAQ